jgi:preprotein translocase subunit SecY
MISLLQRQHLLLALSPIEILSTIMTITAGTVFLMWLGELISEKGISNGVSLLIFAGIVAELPTSIQQSVFTWTASRIPSYILFFVLAILIIMAVVMVNEARRNIPVSYAKRVRGFKMFGGASTYLPININPAGVIPIIFALSILLLPNMMATLFVGAGGILTTIAETLNRLVSNLWIYGTSYFVLVILFTYFYTAVTFDPKSISENLQKMGGFIPGIRPGRSTAEFLARILNRILLIGSLFLGSIAIMPYIIRGITGIQTFEFLIGGTALLIVVSVVLELVRQIKAELQMREYDNY